MEVSVWHHSKEQQPWETGYYLAHSEMTIGNDSEETGYFWWDKDGREWREYSTKGSIRLKVSYWCDATPSEWSEKYYEESKEITAAEADALAEVARAVERYRTVRALSR